MGWTIQHTPLIKFDNVKILARLKIGQEGIYFKIALKALDGGRVNIASCSFGSAHIVFLIITYLHQRYWILVHTYRYIYIIYLIIQTTF